MPNSYAYAAIALVVLAIVVLAGWWVMRWRRNIITAVENAARGEDAARKALEHAAVADVERRDLPAGVAGPRVRDTHKPLG